MPQPTANDLQTAVEEFNNWIKLPNHDAVQVQLMCQFKSDSKWSELYGDFANMAGAYAFENFDSEIFHVGSVSGDSGFEPHFASQYISKGTNSDSIQKSGHAVDATKVHVVALNKELAFLSPALEQFLISYLAPAENQSQVITALRSKLESKGCVVTGTN